MMLGVKQKSKTAVAKISNSLSRCMRQQICVEKGAQDECDNAACSQHVSNLPIGKSKF